MGEERERIDELEAEAVVHLARIEVLEGDVVIRDAKIADLAKEVDGLVKSKEHAAVIEQAKGVIMHSTQCGPDAAFAVLVAASQRENVKLFLVAQRIAAAQDRQPPKSN
ncbi:MAG: hypothetical protein JWO77_962 [Ilumatobacteraceae bacterium]|nr:hypothetical protein [Ilumatobacteraceae bacterium]